MASERFKVLIGDLPPEEEKREYTKKEKAKNFWFYNKWYFIIGAVVLIAVVASVVSIVTKVKPDYTFSIISAQTMPDTLLTSLEKAFATYADDRNNDGQVVVSVSQYNLSFVYDETSSEDPNIRMANMTKLMGDLQTAESMIFFVDDIKGVQENDGFLAYNDGTYPAEGEKTDYSKMGVKWSDSEALSSLPIGKIEMFGIEDPEQYPDGQLFMQDLTMVMRVYDSTNKPESDTAKYFNDSFKIFKNLM